MWKFFLLVLINTITRNGGAVKAADPPDTCNDTTQPRTVLQTRDYHMDPRPNYIELEDQTNRYDCWYLPYG